MMNPHTLSNGIRVASRRVGDSRVAHCGLMLDIGSRDETPSHQGIAHFWEHMAFKGTQKRKAHHVLNRLEAWGGEINAFTDKEKVCFYVSIRDAHLEKAIELLTDIAFYSVFPPHQIERERNVILEEMAMYADDPEDALNEAFDRLVFADHPLGMSILGTRDTVRAFRQRDFRQFIVDRLDTRKVVFSCVSALPEDRVIRLAEKYMTSLPRRTAAYRRKKFGGYAPKETVLRRDITQLRCAIGRPAFAVTDRRRTAFSILVNVLGGAALNSRLNRALRERRGYVYAIGAHYIPFTDTGVFAVSFGADPARLNAVLKLIHVELQRLRETPLGIRQMRVAREQALMQLTLMRENPLSVMIATARNVLDLGVVTVADEVYARVQDTTPAVLQQLACDMFDKRMFCTLCLTPDSYGNN